MPRKVTFGQTSKSVNTTQAAAIIGCTTQYLDLLSREGKATKEPDGKWDVDKLRASLAAIGSGKVEAAEPRRGTLLYEQWRLTREKADMEALERKTLEGSLLKRDEVVEAWSQMRDAARSTMLAIGDQLSDVLAVETNPIRCRELVDQKIRQGLSELAEYPDVA